MRGLPEPRRRKSRIARKGRMMTRFITTNVQHSCKPLTKREFGKTCKYLARVLRK